MKIQEEIDILVELLRYGLSGTHPSESSYDEVTSEYNSLVKDLNDAPYHDIIMRDNLCLDGFAVQLVADYKHKQEQQQTKQIIASDFVVQGMSNVASAKNGICLKDYAKFRSIKSSLYFEGFRIPLDFSPLPCNESIDAREQSSGWPDSFEHKGVLSKMDLDTLLKVESVLNRTIESIMLPSSGSVSFEDAIDELEKIGDYYVIDYPTSDNASIRDFGCARRVGGSRHIIGGG
eukprot:CAMPEP_0116047242 /NCGR_PEP_ID=MMETSP0321-20121206/28754_1 /TAXON_ID=163516 /ORGANISM="Leptocylindrus danicus var. danicus, Strain B650" /LENGTH=232 /DNA_ID=CAMNT_0003529043 /DNA_START=430 /DNA_END=1125 /DNA_ORIENTATION=-